MAIPSTIYLLKNLTIERSPWADLESGDSYKGSKILCKLSKGQYYSYLDYREFVVKEYNKAVRKVDKLGSKSVWSPRAMEAYDHACEILAEMKAEIPVKLEEYVKRNLLK